MKSIKAESEVLFAGDLRKALQISESYSVVCDLGRPANPDLCQVASLNTIVLHTSRLFLHTLRLFLRVLRLIRTRPNAWSEIR